jgi:K+ transporter
VFPIVMTSLMLIFQPRVGGPATAALIANTMWGLVGFSACMFTVHLATVPLGSWAGLALALMVSVVWNIVMYWWGRRTLLRRMKLSPLAPTTRS